MTFEFDQDENQETIGSYLKQLRQEKELTLAEVANILKIHEKYLAAIEADDDSIFPDHVFKDLFIKAYSEYLGVAIEDLLMRLPQSTPAPPIEGAKPAPRPVRPPETAPKPTPISSYRQEEPQRSGGKSLLVAALVVVIIVLGFFLVKLTLDYRTPTKVVIPQAIPKSVPKKQAVVDSSVIVADSTDSGLVADSAAVDTVGESVAPDSVLLLIVGKGRSWFRIRRDSDTTLQDGMIRTNDTLWFAMQDSMFLRFGRANAVDLYLNALPLKIANGNDTSVVSFWLSRDNYLKYVDSSRLAP